MMRAIVRVVCIAIIALISGLIISGQDLGSANKLFGNGAKRPSAKKDVAKKSPAAARPRHSTTGRADHSATRKMQARKGAGAKVEIKKDSQADSAAKKSSMNPHAITTPTGTKLVGPGRTSGDTGASRRFSEKPKVSGTGDPKGSGRLADKPISPADEARFEELIEQGNTARDDRDYTRAETAYKSAQAKNPRDPRAIYGLGNIYNDQQRWEEAENAYRSALRLEPANPMAEVALSYVLTQPLSVADLSDRYAEAEKLARRATESTPASALAFDQLGVALEMRGQIGEETENAYRKAVQLDPAFAPAYAHLGRLLRRRGLAEESKEAYRQATERSTDVGTTVLVAEVMQSEQRYAESIPLLKQALEGDRRNMSALLMLGHALTVTGEYRDAESALQKALAVSSDGYRANVLLASLYMRQGAYELAENALLQVLRSAPAYENRQLAQQFIMLGQGYSHVGKAEQSRRAYSEAAKLDPDSGVLSGRFRQ